MDLKCNNKECEEHNKVLKFSEVRLKINKITGDIEYYDIKSDNQLICPTCLKVLIEHEGEFQGFGLGNVCGFASKTPQEKREILKARERQHQKRDKNFHEYKKFKDNGGQD